MQEGGLRRTAARGVIINAAFLVAVSALAFARGFIVASLLTPEDFGVWGTLVVLLSGLGLLKQAGIGQKFVQQPGGDEEAEFQRAFTLELVLAAIVAAAGLVVLPVLALALGQSQLLAPGIVLLLLLPAAVLQTPIWVVYRRMQFARQRALQAVEPIVGFIVTVGLAAAGAGYWALVIGIVAGAASSAIVIALNSPYRMAFNWDRGALRRYSAFSWPVLVATGSGLMVGLVAVLAGNAALGLAAAGTITLAVSVTQFADRVDAVITETLYPAICAAADRRDVLFESFVKSNRLALIWAVPFGVGLALFAQDLVDDVLGAGWEDAVVLLQVFGLAAAFNQIGFNWAAYLQARGETRPLAAVALIGLVAFLTTALPGMLLWELDGFAGGMALTTAISLAARFVVVQKLFAGFAWVPHTARAMVPAALAAAVVLAGRDVAGPVVELAVFMAVTAAATALLERDLIGEALGYLRRAPASTGDEPAGSSQ